MGLSMDFCISMIYCLWLCLHFVLFFCFYVYIWVVLVLFGFVYLGLYLLVKLGLGNCNVVDFFFFFGSYIWDLENWVGLFVLRNCWIFYVFRVQCWINWKCKLSVWWKTNKWAMCDLLTEMTLISFSIYNGYWVLRSILFV